MSTKINVETFLAVLRKSGLVDRERLEGFLRDEKPQPEPAEDAIPLSDRLISENLITRWQAEKLLQGKHRGYFLGKYKLLSLLGKGGMSSVYLAEHLLLRRRCALKVLPAKRVDDSSYLERFHREAQAVASLDHPNIVRAYDVDHQTDGDRQIHFLVMEFVDGQSLQELVTDKGVLAFLDAAEYTRQAALGLKQAHEQGMIHRDIKPGNLLVDQNGVVKILDLGLAKFFTVEEGNEALTIRHDEKVLGTADYLAPEQALDSHTVDVRADIYSLGCTLYFMLTGQPPFTEGTLAQRLMAHQIKTPPLVESLRAETPPSLAYILRKMMEKQPVDRYQTAEQAERALFEWVDEHADDDWRKLHSDVYGSRSSDSITIRKPIPVAQPVVLKPSGEGIAEPVRKPVSKPVSSKSKLNKPVPQPDPDSQETSIDKFFSTLAQPKSEPSAPKIETPAVIATRPELVEPPRFVEPAAADMSQISLSDAPTPFPQFPSPFTKLDAISETQPATARKSSLTRTGSHKLSATKVKPRLRQGWREKLISLPKSQLGGIAAGGVAVLLVIIYLAGGIGGIGDSAATKSGKPVALAPFSKDQHEVTVGGKGADYPTIRDAINAVRQRYRPRKDQTEPFVIKIAAGVYHESIALDGRTNRWPEGVVLLGDGEVSLEPPGEDPVISLANVSRFAIEKLQINAKDRKVAIELSGGLHESHLSGLVVWGFTEAGVLCKGAQGLSFGTNQLLLEKLTFEIAGPQAVGLRLMEGPENSVESIVVRGCRFLGPLSTGIDVQDPAPYGIDVLESVFNKTSDGIRFENQPLLRSIHIVNNSFRATRNAIRFDKLPKDQSTDLAFRRNLFVTTEHGECVVQRSYDDAKFRTMVSVNPPGAELNWSDRAKPETPYDDEVPFFFEQSGRQGETGFAFASADPKSPKFLAPTENSPQRKVDGAQPIDKQWVGAIGDQ